MRHAIDLPTNTMKLEEELQYVREIIHACRRKKALAMWINRANEIQREITERKGRQVALSHIQTV